MSAPAADASHKRRRDEDAQGSDAAQQQEGAAEKRVKLEDASADSSTTAPAARERKKRRWDTQEPAPAADGAAAAAAATPAPATTAATAGVAAPVLAAAERALALKKSINERLAAAKIPKLAPSASPAAAAVKLEALGAGVGAAASAASSFPSPSVLVKDEKAWLPLRLDAQGRQVDAEGRVIQMARPTELKVNERQQAEAAAAAAMAKRAGMPHAKIATTIVKEEGMSKFHDPRMPESKPVERKPRGLVLVKPGKYMAMAATMRMKQLEKDMIAASRSVAASTADSAPTSVAIVKPGVIPAVEWWDARFLVDPASYSSGLDESRITSYIHHPVEVASLTAAPAPPPMPVLLTKAERKKIKKRNKREMLKEKADRVRQGLDAPPEPKMRLKNLTDILLNNSVADPSAMEAKVRAQMAERVETHESANANRKLSAEAKAERRRRKFAEDTSAQVHVAVYRTGALGEGAGKARYQLDVNAQQWNLSGVAVLHPACTVVVAEGGPKAQRRLRRLMLHRIRWRKPQKSAMERAGDAADGGADGEEAEGGDDEDDDSDDESDAGAAAASSSATVSRTGACALVWSGVVPTARFAGRFTFEACRSEVMARNYLQKLGMEQYWDACRAYRADATDT